MNHQRIIPLLASLCLLLAVASCTPSGDGTPAEDEVSSGDEVSSDNDGLQAAATETPDATATATTAPSPTAEPTATATTAPSPTATALPTASATPAEAASRALGPETFCGDEEARALLKGLQTAVAEEDEEQLAQLIHPGQGLRVRVNWWNPEVHLTGAEVETLLSSETSYDWGTEDGSGRDISGSFSEVIVPRLERDLVAAAEAGCEEILHGPTAGLVQLPEEYEGEMFYSLYRPAPEDGLEMDWGTWAVGVAEWEGERRITFLVHYQWEI